MKYAVFGIAFALMILWTVLWAFAPRDPVVLIPDFDPASLGADLDQSLKTREARVPDLRPGAEKRVLWAGEPGARSAYSIVFIHGFSASSEELRPLPDQLASHFEANLYFARLSGHGRDGAAMGEPLVGDWINDLAEAMEIGRRIGKRVIVMGSSAGGALSVFAALDAQMSQDLAGLILISPAFELKAPGASVLTWPGARVFVPKLMGETRGFAPINEAHGQYWTSSYPSVAVLPLAALVREAGRADLSAAKVPALFVFSEDDAVVDATAIREAAENWGGAREVVPVSLGENDDPMSHILAGDILSPDQTEPLLRRMIDWLERL